MARFTKALVITRKQNGICEVVSVSHGSQQYNCLIYACNYLGYVYWHESNYDSAFYFHRIAEKVAKDNRINDSRYAFTMLMLGNDFFDTGDYVKTSEHYYSALKIYEKLKDTTGLILTHNRLGKLYYKLKDFDIAYEQVRQAERYLDQIPYLRERGFSYNSLGNIYIEKQKTDSALYYFRKTFEVYNRCGDLIGQSIASINLGDTYLSFYHKTKIERFLDSSTLFYQHSLNLNEKAENLFGMIYGYWGIGDNSLQKKDDQTALYYYRKALQLSLKINARSEEYHLYKKMHLIFDKTNKDSSFYYLKKYTYAKEAAESEEKTKDFLRQENKYLIEKRISEENIRNEQEKLLIAEKHKWKNYLLICIVVIALGLAYLVYISIKRVKIIAQKNEVINRINSSLESQHKEITDSINYAKRIQAAVLPPPRMIKEFLPQSFVLYLPKDIIAGDFYWMEKKDQMILLAVADCTGHGVPGAMVSVICNNGLNRSVREHGITEPGKILDKTREIIVQEFEKSDEDVKDGMDISLLSLSGLTMRWAGANNPIWIIREGNLIEIRADKQPIGKFAEIKPFTTHVIELQKNDSFYIFTDGYADQFGGEKGKKFKYAQLKSVLLSINNLEMSAQKEILEQKFKEWRGDLEQVDDVCIVGVRI